ncbi:MAG: 1,4-dihydroxy-2-naphthoyl-CoA hydrolase [Solirubrobacteraceae bacterium]|jgi:uncharacterized protein (TIGR00369 family)|nr:1,4-dihydroxy-2-naphthoyl-CoA hydrolase [Solirubrobacteraceae bacterium]
MPEPVVDIASTFEGYLGLNWIELTEELAHVTFDVRDGLKQPLGLVHGGIYSSVAETLASVATVYGVWQDGFTGSGISNVASFLRPITKGTVDVMCRRASHEADRWVWHTEFTDENENLCSLVEVAIAVRPLPR